MYARHHNAEDTGLLSAQILKEILCVLYLNVYKTEYEYEDGQ